MTNNDDKSASFLHETQKEGHGKATLAKKDLDEAIETVHMIINTEVAKELSGKKTEDVEPVKMAIYCHDCRGLVPAGVGQGRRGKMRTVCGTCKSKKISRGRKEALESFYHIKENALKREEASKKKPRPAKKLQKKKK